MAISLKQQNSGGKLFYSPLKGKNYENQNLVFLREGGGGDEARNPYWKERLSTLDHLVQTSSDQLMLYWKYYVPFLQNKLSQLGGQPYWAFPFS